MADQDGITRRGLSTPAAILIGSVLISASILVASFGGTWVRPQQEAAGPPPVDEKALALAPVTAADHVYGSRQSKVFLIEYADTECPYCKGAIPVLKRIVDESNGGVAWVYRHFPLDALHPEARIQAAAAECAAASGGDLKFWDYLMALSRGAARRSGAAPSDRLSDLAADIGLDRAAFASCLSSGAHAGRIESHYQEGMRIGITGTPSTVLVNAKGDRKLLVGAQPEQAFRAAIDALR